MSSLPKYDDWKHGWYMRDNKWFLTVNAILKEFHIPKKELQKLLLITRYGEINYGSLEKRSSINRHNQKSFIIYSYEDTKLLIHQLE